jgi:hypothetical protein
LIAASPPRIVSTPCLPSSYPQCRRCSGRDEHAVTALERAFQLAKSGQVSGLTEIVKALRREGYSANQIEGPALKRQLAALIKTARAGGASS